MRVAIAVLLGLGLQSCASERPAPVAEPIAEPVRLARIRGELERAQESTSRGDPDGARVLLAAVESDLESIPAPEPDEEIAALESELGILAFQLGLGETAERALDRAIAQQAVLLPPGSPELLRSRLALAMVWKEQGRLREAREVEEAALLILEQERQDDDPFLQRVRQNLGVTLWIQGELVAARDRFEEVRASRSRTLPPDDPALLAIEANLAVVTKDLGDLRGALALEEHVLEASLRTLPPGHQDIDRARQNLANTLHRLGWIERAKEIDEIVFAERSRTLPDDHPELQEARANLATSLAATGDPEGARELEQRVLEAREKALPDGDPRVQSARAALAATLQQLGDLDEARALLEQVLEAGAGELPPDHPHLQAMRSNLASVLRQMGDLEGAGALEEQVLEQLSATLPADHPDRVHAEKGLATTLALRGELDRARVLLEEVLAARVRALPPGHPQIALTRADLGVALALAGDLVRARVELESALESLEAERSGTDTNVLRLRGDLVTVLDRLGERDAAILEARRLSADLRSFAREAALEAAPRAALSRCASMTHETSIVLSIASGAGSLAPADELDGEAFALVETFRGVGLLSSELLAAAREDVELERLRRRILESSAEIARLVDSDTGIVAVAAARREKEKAQRNLLDHLAVGDPASALAEAPERASLAATLSPGEAMVSVWRFEAGALGAAEGGEDRLLAFVLLPGAGLRRVDLGSREEIAGAVERWRESLGASADARGIGSEAGADSPAAERLAGIELRRRVIDPIRAAAGDARVWRIALDDVLHTAPLDALPEGSPDGSLGGSDDPEEPDLRVGDRLTIETRSSLGECLSPARERGARGKRSGPEKLLALGGLDYEANGAATGATARGAPGSIVRSSDGSARFAPLPATRAEVRAIRALWHGAEGTAVFLEGDEGTHEALLALAPGTRWLHVATHGWFAAEPARPGRALSPLSERPSEMSPMLLCGLALSGANQRSAADGRRPGAITAEELAAVDLSDCDLAVLSACETAVGERRAGQGVASLQKALHLAGTRSVVTSLWKVPDEATKELMIEFYRRIWVLEEPRSSALWEAKKSLRAARDEAGQAKYSTRDWAAWVLSGDPR